MYYILSLCVCNTLNNKINIFKIYFVITLIDNFYFVLSEQEVP